MCVEGDAAETGGVRKTIDAIRQDPGTNWSAHFPGAASVERDCPGEKPAYSQARLAAHEYERCVSEPSPFLLHVALAPGVEQGYQRTALEMSCQGQAEVTTLLFVDAPLVADEALLREALEYGLGISFKRDEAAAPGGHRPGAPDDKGTPPPGATPVTPVPAALLQAGICVALAPGADPAMLPIALEAVHAVLEEAGVTSPASSPCPAPYVDPRGQPPGSVLGPAPEGATAAGIYVFVPAYTDRAAVFGPDASFLRYLLRQPACERAACPPEAAAVYLNPGLFDAPELVASVLREAVLGKAAP